MSALLVSVLGKDFIVDVQNGRCVLNADPAASGLEISPGVFSVLVDGASIRVLLSREGESYTAYCGGIAGEVSVETERSRLLKKYAAADPVLTRKAEIHAPMPALVVNVEVKAGQSVKKGDGLVVLEAMKMENELRAPHDGTVKKVLVEKGMKVEKGELILLFE